MDQEKLERIAKRLFTLKNVDESSSSLKISSEIELLKIELEAAKRERLQMLLRKSSRKGFQRTTVGQILQTRIRSKLLPPPTTTTTTTTDVLHKARVLKLGEQLTSYRLAGISTFSVGGRPNDLGLRFDSTYGVRFYLFIYLHTIYIL